MAKKRIQLDPSREGAEQLLESLRKYSSVCWDGTAWVSFNGQPTGQTLTVVRPATEASRNDPLAGLFAVYWRTKGDGSVVPISADIDGSDTTDRVVTYLTRVQDWIDTTRRRGCTERTPIPESIAQPTFIEARYAGQALADGPTQRYWEEAAGEVAMLHVIPEAPIQTKVHPSSSLQWLDKPATVEAIKADLHSAGVPAIIAMHTALDLTIKHERVSVTLDDLMSAVGWVPRSTAERAQKRRTLWRWLLLFDSMLVISQRPGTYKDPMTKKLLNLQSFDPLLRIVGHRDVIQTGLDDSEPPIEVSLVAGKWVEKFHMGGSCGGEAGPSEPICSPDWRLYGRSVKCRKEFGVRQRLGIESVQSPLVHVADPHHVVLGVH